MIGRNGKTEFMEFTQHYWDKALMMMIMITITKKSNNSRAKQCGK